MRPTLSRRQILSAATGMIAASVPLSCPSRARTASLDRVNIVTAAGNLALTFEELMRQLGLLAKFGLVAEPVHVSDGSKLMGSLLSGEMDLCPLAGFAQIFPAVQHGAKLKIINGAVLLGQQTVFSARPEIHSVRDLAGRTIGVGSVGSQLHQTMVALLLKKGVDPATVTFANLGSSTDVFRAVAAKVVDAGPSQIDFIPDAHKFGVKVLEGGDMWSNVPEYPFQGGFAADRAIAGKRDIIIRTLAAYAAMFRFVAGPDSRDAFLAARRNALAGAGQEFDEVSMFQWEFFQRVQPFALDLIIPMDRIAYLQALNVRLGIQTRVLPYDSAIDLSLAQAAIALL
jgi:ABC-type nitrate/sulfonate/bicarbonate transport system substrate-binding protein